jgi:capsular polysaccharide biosynthesis protein
MSIEIVVAFITGVLGPLLIIIAKDYLNKRKVKPDLVHETLKVSELVTSRIEHINEEF